MIVIVDYGMGNLRSIQYKLEKAGVNALISSRADEIERAEKLILPGVGAFGAGMRNLRELDLIPLLNWKVLEQKTAVLGVCLGLQLFSGWSDEGNVAGLNWIGGKTRKFNFAANAAQLRVPHVGWNDVEIHKNSPLLDGVESGQRFYFTHSYHLDGVNPECVVATTRYGYEFVSVIQQGHIFGAQFHPEKSHRRGIDLYLNFARDV